MIHKDNCYCSRSVLYSSYFHLFTNYSKNYRRLERQQQIRKYVVTVNSDNLFTKNTDTTGLLLLIVPIIFHLLCQYLVTYYTYKTWILLKMLEERLPIISEQVLPKSTKSIFIVHNLFHILLIFTVNDDSLQTILKIIEDQNQKYVLTANSDNLFSRLYKNSMMLIYKIF